MRATPLRNALAALIAAALLTAAAPMTEPAAPAAQLSVTLDSKTKTVSSGDTVAYTGRVKNLADTDADVKIVVDAPAYVTLRGGKGGTIDKNQATWTTTVRPGADASFTVDGKIGKIPTTERRVTTLASVYVGDTPSPVVRTAAATFIDGVDDTPGGKAKGKPAAASSGAPAAILWWGIAGAVLLLLVIAGVVIIVVVRRRRRRPRRTA